MYQALALAWLVNRVIEMGCSQLGCLHVSLQLAEMEWPDLCLLNVICAPCSAPSPSPQPPLLQCILLSPPCPPASSAPVHSPQPLTHTRPQVCTKIVETERGVATTYPGNYTQYTAAKVEEGGCRMQGWYMDCGGGRGSTSMKLSRGHRGGGSRGGETKKGRGQAGKAGSQGGEQVQGSDTAE